MSRGWRPTYWEVNHFPYWWVVRIKVSNNCEYFIWNEHIQSCKSLKHNEELIKWVSQCLWISMFLTGGPHFCFGSHHLLLIYFLTSFLDLFRLKARCVHNFNTGSFSLDLFSLILLLRRWTCTKKNEKKNDKHVKQCTNYKALHTLPISLLVQSFHHLIHIKVIKGFHWSYANILFKVIPTRPHIYVWPRSSPK